MYKAVLRTQWHWSWAPVLGCAVLAFAIPLLSVQGAVVAPGVITNQQGNSAEWMLRIMEPWGPLYTIVAAALGLAVAMLAWAADHRGRHVYALSLPLPRWHFVWLRFGSGALLLVVPIVTLGIGALLATAMIDIPHGLTAYPIALTLRFALAAIVAYAIFFAISAGTSRTAAYILVPIIIVIVLEMLLDVAGIRIRIVESIGRWLLAWPGFLEVFTGRWLLINV